MPYATARKRPRSKPCSGTALRKAVWRPPAWGEPLVRMGDATLAVKMHAGWMFVRPGYFVVKADGEAWPLPPAIFAKRYEVIDP